MASSQRPFVVVAFQRSLKHHALFHCLFGHELGHTALQTLSAGAILNSEVITAFTSSGPLSDNKTMNIWAKCPAGTMIEDEYRESWLDELSCDLFGLILFGPAFLAAHRTYLSHLDPDPHHIDFTGPTHPPYAVRQKMLRRALELLNWHQPITNEEFERKFLAYLLDDSYDPWAMVFDDHQLSRAIAGIQQVIGPLGRLAYNRVTAEQLMELVSRLSRQLPPVLADITTNGDIVLDHINVAQILHAGWAYWIGQDKLPNPKTLSFFQTNRLCDLALLQQRAINDAKDSGIE
jgi:hypothetical protein